MKRLLLTGASGFLGWNLCRLAHHEWEIFGTFQANAIEIPGVRLCPLDLTSPADVTELFRRIRPHAVIHAAAAANPNLCQENPNGTARVNVEASIHIAALCADSRIPCLFTSTDLVFDGLNPPYAEDDPPSPVNVYGMQKVRAEQGMMHEYPEVTICRMPLMFGDPGPAASSFIQPMVRAMREGRELKLFTDEFRTPVSGRDAALGLLLVLGRGASGIIHLGGKERISRHAFGELLASALGIRGARLVRCLRQDVPMVAPRSRDVSLDSSKAFAMGFQPAPLESSLKELAGGL
jgi:dTDP-4-dehydrorhamnose reductase